MNISRRLFIKTLGVLGFLPTVATASLPLPPVVEEIKPGYDEIHSIESLEEYNQRMQAFFEKLKFEMNDSYLRNRILHFSDKLLNSLHVKGKLYDYRTICDLTNNTPNEIDKNKVVVDVFVKPDKTQEMIHINIITVSPVGDIGDFINA